MKATLTIVLLTLSFSVISQDKGEKGSFEERKANLTAHLNKRIEQLQKSKSCVSEAKDEKALRACHEKMREHRQKLREKMRTMKKERKEKKD